MSRKRMQVCVQVAGGLRSCSEALPAAPSLLLQSEARRPEILILKSMSGRYFTERYVRDAYAKIKMQMRACVRARRARVRQAFPSRSPSGARAASEVGFPP